MEDEPADDILEPMFRDKIKDCKCISHDYETYLRADRGSANKSFQFLYDAVDNFLLRKLRETNRYDVQKKNKDSGRNERSNSRSRPAAPATQKDGRRGRKQSRGNSRGSGKRNSSKDGSERRMLNSKQKGGVCYTWKNTGKCDKHEKGECGYSHKDKDKGANKDGGRGRSNSSGSSSSSRSNKSKSGKGRGKGKKGGKRAPTPPGERKNVTCTFYIRHKCTKGNDCEFKHDSKEQEDFQKKMKKKKEDFQ